MSVVAVLTTTEPIPNDPWAFQPGMDAVIAETVKEAIIAVYNTYEGRQALETLISPYLTGISAAQDSDYDFARRLVSAFGLEMDPCSEPVQIGFPYAGDDPAAAIAAADEFVGLLSVETGLNVQASVQPCASNVVRQLGEWELDAALLSGVDYVFGHDQYGFEARLVNGRYGLPYYKGQINVQAAKGYTNLWDLQNKTIAFPENTSFSGYMAPYLLISETTGMVPEDFFSEISFSGDHSQVIREVYTGSVDSGGSYFDARPSIEGEYPDVMSVVAVLTTTEPIPNDLWAFHTGLDPTLAQVVADGIISVANSVEGDAALDILLNGNLTGITPVEDSDYDFLRRMVTAFGLEPSSCEETVRVEFPYVGDGSSAINSAADEFAALLSQETGFDVQASVACCMANVVEHLGEGYADLSPISAVGYVHGHDQYGIEAALVNERYGLPYYMGQINVPAAMGYTSLWDLQNKRIAFPDEGSISGYMAPYLLISETTGIRPEDFFSEIHFSGSHPQVILDVYTGSVDCGGSYWDARPTIEGEHPDVMSVVAVLTTTEQIPNDPWAFRPGMDAVKAETLKDGIIAVYNTYEGRQALETLISPSLTEISAAQDSDYDLTRQMVSAFGLELDPFYEVYLPLVLRILSP
jgi:phosphonate transport system substrate-binding protein